MNFVTKNGSKIKLPKWTMKQAILQDQIEHGKERTNEKLYTLMYGFVLAILDSQTLAQELEGDNLMEVDLNALVYLYGALCHIYAGNEQPPRKDD